MRGAAPDDPQNRANHDRAEHHRNSPDLPRSAGRAARPTIKTTTAAMTFSPCDPQCRSCRGDPARFAREIGRIVREPQRARSDAQRPLKKRLPDDKGTKAAVPSARRRTLRAGKRSFRPPAASPRQVPPRCSRRTAPAAPRRPRQQASGSAHGLDHERNHDERPDAHHERHVQRRGFDQAQPAFEFLLARSIEFPFFRKSRPSIARNAAGARRKLRASALPYR